MYIYIFIIRSSADGHLAWFQFPAVENIIAISLDMQVLQWENAKALEHTSRNSIARSY